MASPILVGAFSYRAVSDVTTRNLGLAGLVDAAGSTVAIQDGDFLILYVFYAGNSTTNSVSGLTGLTKLDDNAVLGCTSTVYYKQSCVVADSSATIAIGTSAANRTCAIVLVYRNVPVGGFLGWAKSSLNSNNVATGPTVVPSAIGGIRLELAAWSATQTPTAVPTPAAGAGLTQIRTEANAGTMPGHVGAMSGAPLTGAGQCAGNAAHNLTPATTTASVGGTVWTGEAITPAGNSTTWVLVLAGTTAAASVRPITSISSTGMSNVGTATSIVAALTDELDTTGGETTDNPVGIVEEVLFAPLAAQARVRLDSRLVVTSTTTGSVTYLIQIRQGASTVICSKSVVVASTAGVVPDALLSTALEASAITNWSDLRARWTMTKV